MDIEIDTEAEMAKIANNALMGYKIADDVAYDVGLEDMFNKAVVALEDYIDAVRKRSKRIDDD